MNETEQDTESTDKLDNFFQGETTTEVELTPEQKEEKKGRDFEAGMKKFQSQVKELKAENAALKSKQEIVEIEEDPGVKKLQELIDQSVQKAISPVTEASREEQESKVWSQFQTKEHVNALLPQIQSYYSEMPKTGNLDNDLETARLVTIGKYHKDLINAAVAVGEERGYAGRKLKTSQAGFTERPIHTGKDNFAERVRSGADISIQEWRERQDEIQQIYKEDAGL